MSVPPLTLTGAMRVPPPSPPLSPSLLEIKEETRLVLEAFLRRSVALPTSAQPGRVGGSYRDPYRFRAKSSAPESDAPLEGSWSSLHEQIAQAEEKKHGFKTLIKKRLRRRPSGPHSQSQRGAGPSPPGPRKSNSLGPSGHSQSLRLQEKGEGPGLLACVGGGASDEETDAERQDRRKKPKSPFLSLFRRKSKDQVKLPIRAQGEELGGKTQPPGRPNWLPLTPKAEPVDQPRSPTHDPDFYREVAETLERIAQKRSLPRPSKPSPAREDSEKELIVQQLVNILSMQGDAINQKINSDPFLRSSLSRLSYGSFSTLVETFTTQTEALPPAPASPTLSRIAVTMEVSRRVATATGVQRVVGYTEKYMEKFVPWIQRNGGWEKIVQCGDLSDRQLD
nr:PREDICTED: bcl-2-like protein 12 isoform X1 [Lepisosteus oculatus]